MIDVASNDDLPDEALSRGQERERIWKVLLHYRREQYEAVRLSYIEGLSHNEITGVLGAPIGTVKSRLWLAYEEIRDAVEKKK